MSLSFAALTKVYAKANSVVSYDVNCPNWLHKYIIGKKGAKLQTLMGDLGTKVIDFESHYILCDQTIFTKFHFDGIF